MQKVVVEILAGPNVGETYDFDRDQILVGRGSQCQLQLASPHVSRQQCELTRQGDQLVLENLGSVNVTYLNDRPIDRVYVQDGDLITFCDVALRIRLPRPGQDAMADPDRTVAYSPNQPAPGGQPTPHRPPQPPQPPPPQAPPVRPQPPPQPPPPQPPPPQPRHTSQPHAPPPQRPMGGEPTAPPGPLPAGPTRPPQPPPPPPQAPAGVGMGTGLQPAMGGQAAPPSNLAPTMPPGGSGQHVAMPPGPPPGMPPGAMPGRPGVPPGRPPGMPPGMPGQMPPGMPGQAPPGMPGRAPGGHPGMPSQGVISARRKRKKGGGKGGGGGGGSQPLNIQLIRNVVVGLAAVMVLLMITSAIINRSPSTNGGVKTPVPTVPPGGTPTPAPDGDAARRDRTDEEIIRDAESAFQTATTYLRQHRIADENLSISIENFRQARAELGLVDMARWPAWTADIDPKTAEAEGLLDQKFKEAKLAYVRSYQSADYERALQELERILRLVPDKNDSRNDYARTRIRTIREIMSGGKKKGRWDKHKM